MLESAYAEPTQENSSPPSRSAVMVGSAVPTAVRSRALRNTETQTAVKVSQKAEPLPLGGSPAGGASVDAGRESAAGGDSMAAMGGRREGGKVRLCCAVRKVEGRLGWALYMSGGISGRLHRRIADVDIAVV